MPQVQLRLFPEGTTSITSELGFEPKSDQVVYLNRHLPGFTHSAKDLASFRLFTTQLIIDGTASHGQVAKAFGVPLRPVKRYTKRFREHGADAFFKPKPKRSGHRLTSQRLIEVQRMLDEGLGIPEISQRTGVLQTTLHKAIGAGRLRASKKNGSRRAERGIGAHEESAQRAGCASALGSGQQFSFWFVTP